MSDLSRFLKRQEHNVRGIYDRNLGDLVEEWKRPVLGATGGLLAGAAFAPFAPAAAPYLMASLGAAGGAGGYQRTKDRQGQWAAAADRERQERELRNAEDRLEGIIDPYLPGEDAPEDDYAPPGTPQPPTPPISPPEPPIAPPGAPEGPPIGIPTPPPDMGNLPTGGPETGVGTILDENERAREMQLQMLQQQQQQKEAARAEMAQILNQQMERQFDETRPEIYEDLNRRGLLRSTATGEALAEERGRLSAGVNEQLGLQGIQDMYGGIGQQGNILDTYLQGRQSGLGRKISLEDWARQMQASKELGQAVTPIQPYTGGGKGGEAQTGMAAAGLGMQAAGMGK